MSPDIEQIASVHGIDYGEAEEFCRTVFGHFCGEVVPKYSAVAEAVTANPSASAAEIAALLRPAAKAKPTHVSQAPLPQPTVTKPLDLNERTPRYTKSRIRRRSKSKSTKVKRKRNVEKEPEETREPLRTDSGSRYNENSRRDKERVKPESLGKCPHGVPYTTRCRICNPSDFD